MSGNSDSQSNMNADSICGVISTKNPPTASSQPSAPPLDADGYDKLYPCLPIQQQQQHQQQHQQQQQQQQQQHQQNAASFAAIVPQVSFTRSESVPVDDFEVVQTSNLPLLDNYLRQVTHIGAIAYSRSKVMGMVLFNQVLYVVHKRSNVLCKYNLANTSPNSFIVPPVSNQTISGLHYPRGLAVNRRTESLFLTDRRKLIGLKDSGGVVKVSLDGAVLAHVEFDFEPFGVSVGAENERIIVACCKNTSPISLPFLATGYILIFEDANGRLREQHLISLEESVNVPRHVIEAPQLARKGHGKEYLVVYGWSKLPTLECHHRISRISSQGRVMRSFGAGHGSGERQLDRPMSMCLDDSDKMFVADCCNDRVLLLTRNPSENHDLELVRPLVTVANGLRRPRHVCLETTKSLLFVGQDSGRIDVFLTGKEVKQTKLS